MPTSKIFCIGLNKTGTASLHFALKRLGYKSLHNHSYNDRIHYAIIEGKPLLHYFDEEFDAYLDLSGIRGYFKLADLQYPNSKFILTVRDLQSWLESRMQHVRQNVQNKSLGKYSGSWLEIDFARWERMWYSHQQDVLNYFSKKNNLLIFNIVAGEGYELLCPFLGKPVLNETFPWKNAGSNTTHGKFQ